MSITLKELARHAGVSSTAASFVMNRKSSGHVTEEKASEIRALARELGYRPNIQARSLRGCARKLIGVVMVIPRDSSASLFSGLLQCKLRELGYMSLFSFWNSYDDVAACYRVVLDHNVDGIIAWENPTPELAGATPQVLYYTQDSERFDSVIIDNRSMIREAVDLFVAAGRRRIAVLDSASNPCHLECEQYLQEKGLPPPLHWNSTPPEFIRNLPEHELPKETFPDAIFVHNDAQAEVMARYIRKRGWRVPEDVMVIGCNNMVEMIPEKPLPTFDIRHEQIVNTLIKLLFRRIKEPDAETVCEAIRPLFVPQLNTAIYQLNQRGNPS